MMTLYEAARVFDNTPFTDLGSVTTYYGQILPFQDNVRSGLTSTRRILEVDPDVVVPEAIINVPTGEVFIVANPSYDQYLGSNIRAKYPIVLSEAQYTLKTPRQVLESSAGVDTRASVHYNRREPLTESVEAVGGFLAIVPASVSASAGNFLTVSGDYFRVLEDSFLDPIGLPTFEVVRIPDAIQTLTITTGGTFDPATETIVGGSSDPSLCIVEPRDKSFEFMRGDALKTESGDVSIHTLGSCEVGDTIGGYKIHEKRVEDTVNILHCRVL